MLLGDSQTLLVYKPVPSRQGWESLEWKHILKGLILAQNERWRRGLGMQVERIPWGVTPAGEVAKGAVRRG